MIPNLTLIITLYASARLLEMPLKDNKYPAIRVLLGVVVIPTLLLIWSIALDTIRSATRAAPPF